MIYMGTEIKNHMLPRQKAKCIVGLYCGYMIEKWRYGNVIVWENGEIVDENDKFFRLSEWEILVDTVGQSW